MSAGRASIANTSVLVVALGLVGCGYPEFGFDAPDGAEPTADTAIADDAADTAIADDSVADTTSDVLVDSADSADTMVDTATEAGCASSTATFCDDFDSVTAVGANWSNADIQGPGALSLDKSGRSAPNAFLANVGVPTSGTLVTAFLYKNFTAPSNTTPMRAEAWLKLDSATLPTTGTGTAFLLKVERTGTTGDGVTVSIDGTGLFAERIGQTYERYPIATKVKPGVWMRIRVDTILHTATGSLAVYVDDMVTPVVNKSGVSTAKGDSSARTLDVGLFVERGTSSFSARFDDVSFAFR